MRIQVNRKITVVIASDQKTLCSGIKLLLKSYHEFNFVLALKNGLELMDYINKIGKEPDIALIDIATPETNGIETLKHLVKYFPKTKWIVLSVERNFEMITRVINAGAKGFLLRDSSAEFIVETIIEVNKKGYHYDSKIWEEEGKLKKIDREEYQNSIHHRKNKLTPREKEYIILCCKEYENKEIAIIMRVSLRTVDGYSKSVKSKFGIKNKAGIIVFAIASGIYKVEFLTSTPLSK